MACRARRASINPPIDRAAAVGLHLVEPLIALRLTTHVRRDEPVLHHAEQIAAAAGERGCPAALARLPHQRQRVREIARVRRW